MIIGGIALFLILVVGGYFGYRTLSGQADLTVWTIEGNEEAIKKVADIYHDKHPLSRIRIVPMSPQVYEFQSLYALASQEGPDIWIIPNDWMTQHRNKLVAAPDGSLDTGISSYQRKRNKEEPKPQFPPNGRTNDQIIEQDYAPIIKSDLVENNELWGVPLNLDTLALFYDRSKINPPPKTWNEVAELARRFTIRDGDKITRSTIALGETQSIAHAIDILSILMLQNGTQMVDEPTNVATFNISQTGATPPGTNAIDYYTSFATPNRETYTWNPSLGPDLQALKQGKTLMAVGYLDDLKTIGPIGNTTIATAPLPQVDPNNPKTYGNYQVATVTKQAKNPDAAWDFISLFANLDITEQYAKDLRTIPARKDVAERLSLGPHFVAFQGQVSQAVAWEKKEVGVANQTLREAIDTIHRNHEKPQVALDVAGKSYTEFLQTPSGIETAPDVLSFWQSTDDATDYRTRISEYVIDNKDLKRIAVSTHKPERYEWEILNAMAGHQGPDIALLPNDQINRFAPTLRPFLEGYFNRSQGRVNDLLALERSFAPAVVTDNVVNGKLYGLPAAFETLMIAYNTELFQNLERENRDTFDNAYNKNEKLFRDGPLLWEDLKTMSRIATKRDGESITRPFIALGTGNNIAHAQDIYAVLIKQFGGELTDPDRLVAGIHLPKGGKVPGREAESLIKSFSNPGNDFYTWNESQANSLEAFADGKVMATFVYPRDLKKIKERNPKIQIGTFVLPQLVITGDPVDYASYYSLTLPETGKRPNDVIRFIRTAVYNSVGNYQPALLNSQGRKILERTQGGNPQAIQVNSAQSYYKGSFPTITDEAILDLLDGRLSLEQAANKINQSLKRKILQ